MRKDNGNILMQKSWLLNQRYTLCLNINWLPENLLVDENGNLKISDFGLSALAESRRQDGLLHTTCGTPAYNANYKNSGMLLMKGKVSALTDVNVITNLNAFDIISLSEGFNLSGLFEEKKKIFEVTPAFHLVEIKKNNGDTLEYENFA
ncbi:hypothetical protein ACJX0J_029172 [Zea mays]